MADVVFRSRPMNVTSIFDSQVDIIIPYHGQYQLVSQLVTSIFRYTRSNYYQIMLVDDCSPNEHYFKTLIMNAKKHGEKRGVESNLNAIRMPEHKGFGAACNAGLAATESPYVCFINSDCEIQDTNWLRSLGECLLTHRSGNVRMVSPMSNNAVDGHPDQCAEKSFRNTDPVILGDGEYLSLFCVLADRKLFQEIGGFKEYPFGYYEDQEFAARMSSYHYKQAVCRTSWVWHRGCATVHRLWRENPKFRDVMEIENRNRCIEDMKRLKR